MIKNVKIFVMSIILGSLFLTININAIQNKISKEQIKETVKEFIKNNPEKLKKSEENQNKLSINQEEFKNKLKEIIKEIQNNTFKS